MVGPSSTMDAHWMGRALLLAERGRGRTTPNPLVGACVVSEAGVVVGQGAHLRAGEPHAEVFALDEAGDRAPGATLYCTLEPCAHTGRTGPCTERIIAAGIRRVVAALEDPDPRVKGRGVAALRRAGIDVDVGVRHGEAARLNEAFLTALAVGRPFVILKAAVSLDGCIAASKGVRTALSGLAAQRHAQHTRARVDAVAVGSETVLIDDPWLTVRQIYRERPLARVIFDRRLRTPPGARVLSTLAAGPVIIMTSPYESDVSRARANALESAGATVIAIDEPRLGPMLRRLVSLDIQSVLLEGGAAVYRSAWDEGVVDCVQVYVAPHALGPSGVPLPDCVARAIPGLLEQQVRPLGADVIIEGYVHRAD